MPLIINGNKIKDTNIVTSLLDDARYSWGPGDFGTDRRDTPEIITGHWTAGESGLRSYDDDGPWVARVLKKRKSRHTGEPLRVSIHFVIGACLPDDPGLAPIWQCADPATTACVHVGSRIVNRRSIGVEVVNIATPKHELKERDREEKKAHLLGRDFTFLNFFPAQLRSWLWLCDTLTGVLDIPRALPAKGGELLTDRMTIREARKWKGLMEHYHMWNTNKVDAGSFLLQSCLGEGYSLVDV